VLPVAHGEDSVIDVRQVTGAVDLWLCMWEPDEQQRYETAVVRTLTDANPRATRLSALALAHVIATPRLVALAARIARVGMFCDAELSSVQVVSRPLKELLQAGCRLRGNMVRVEQLLVRFVDDHDDRVADALLDWVDIRDLVAVARTTIDARLFGEIERRIARRGKYQQGRAANLLGFRVRAPGSIYAVAVGK
jgi:hypothetical protein